MWQTSCLPPPNTTVSIAKVIVRMTLAFTEAAAEGKLIYQNVSNGINRVFVLV